MSRVCEATGKKKMFGGNRQHNRGKAGGTSGPWAFKATRTLHQWKPNLRSVKVNVNSAPTSIKISMKAYKKLKENGKIWIEEKNAFAHVR